MDAKQYSLEVEVRSKNTNLEAVNYSNQALMDRNLDLKSQYEALQKHSLLLTQQNRDLQKELDQFVETDDIVRRNLDRKDKVDQIRSKVDNAIHQSTHIVARQRSPVREIVEVTQVKKDTKRLIIMLKLAPILCQITILFKLDLTHKLNL